MKLIKLLDKQARKQELVKKIQQGAWFNGKKELEEEKEALTRKMKNPLALFFTLLGKKVISKELSDPQPLKIKFLKAGIQWENIQPAFWGAKLSLPFFSVGVALVLRFLIFTTMTPSLSIATIALFALFGFYLPEIWLKNKSDKRKEILLNGLPDALDMLVICVEAGMGLDSAIDRVGREMKLIYPDLSQEFSLMNLEIRAGKEREEALRNLGLRTDLDEIKSLVTLLIQTNKFGTSVAAALKVFSDSFRTKRAQKAEELAAKLPVKILFPLIFFILPSMFVIIMGPAAISIYKNIIMN